jgi:hypothetical protein
MMSEALSTEEGPGVTMTPLRQRLDLLGSICGLLGAGSCVLAVVMRMTMGPGNPPVFIAPRNILLGGIALMVFACWLKLCAR